MCFIEYHESWRTINESGESCTIKIDLIKETYLHLVELRGVDVGHELLQIFGNSIETKFGKNGKDGAFW